MEEKAGKTQVKKWAEQNERSKNTEKIWVTCFFLLLFFYICVTLKSLQFVSFLSRLWIFEIFDILTCKTRTERKLSVKKVEQICCEMFLRFSSYCPFDIGKEGIT